MKTLPLCTLSAGVLFVAFGVRAVYGLGERTEPFGLLVPLVWDIIMVGIGLGLILRCEIARRAGIVWGYFCIVACLIMGGGTLLWILRPGDEPPGTERVVFTVLTYAFGLVFGFWQLHVLRSPATLDWTKHEPSAGASKHPFQERVGP
jgi:hypothetical protein